MIKRKAVSQATSGDVAFADAPRRRGRPKTRARLSLLWFVWRMVREEIAYRNAENVCKACVALINRLRVIRVRSEDGQIVTDVVDAVKLRQWYAAAERARGVDHSDLALRCAAWEGRTAREWSERAAQGAFWKAQLDAELRGLRFPHDHAAMTRSYEMAAQQARSMARTPRAPRKNRR